MLGYDLTCTKLAQGGDAIRLPTEGELLAILIALLLLHDCAVGELSGHSLRLTSLNRDQVAALIRSRLTPLARDFIGPLEARLGDLLGLTVIDQTTWRFAENE